MEAVREEETRLHHHKVVGLKSKGSRCQDKARIKADVDPRHCTTVGPSDNFFFVYSNQVKIKYSSFKVALLVYFDALQWRLKHVTVNRSTQVPLSGLMGKSCEKIFVNS